MEEEEGGGGRGVLPSGAIPRPASGGLGRGPGAVAGGTAASAVAGGAAASAVASDAHDSEPAALYAGGIARDGPIGKVAEP